MSSAEVPKVGDILKERRQETGLAVEVLANRTRIRRAYLLALEENRFDIFPGEAYLTGFLRVYAAALGLSPERLTAVYHQQVGERDERLPEMPELPVSTLSPGRRKSIPWTWLAATVLILFALALVSLTLPQPEPSRPMMTAGGPHEAAALTEAPEVESAPTQPSEAAPTLPSVSEEPSPPVEAASAPPSSRVSTAVVEVERASGSTGAGAVPLIFTFPGNGQIRLQALGPNQVEVRSDNRPAQSYQLSSAAVLSWKVQNRAHIRVEKPEAAKVWLDDRPLDLQGRSEFLLQVAVTTGNR